MAACKKFFPFTSFAEVPVSLLTALSWLCVDVLMDSSGLVEYETLCPAGYVSHDKMFEVLNVGVCYHISEI
jgi:hypothetical protein